MALLLVHVMVSYIMEINDGFIVWIKFKKDTMLVAYGK